MGRMIITLLFFDVIHQVELIDGALLIRYYLKLDEPFNGIWSMLSNWHGVSRVMLPKKYIFFGGIDLEIFWKHENLYSQLS